MPSPFPGMDPYLENSSLWPGVHSRLIVALSDVLTPQLVPKYLVDIEQRVYQSDGEDSVLVGIPDVSVQRQRSSASSDRESNVAVAAPAIAPETVRVPVPERVRQSYLEIRERETRKVITAIEILSPVNKRLGRGREKYEKKRLNIFGSRTHLVEIDLLRSGEPMLVYNNPTATHYRILVSRGDRRPTADLYGFNIQQQIPVFPLPLQPGDLEPEIDLHELLNQVYDRARYDLRIDYNRNPVPPLSESDAAWVDSIFLEKGLRAK